MKIRHACFSLLLVLITLAMTAPLMAGEGTAEGTLTVGGEPFALKYAYALAREGVFDSTKEDIVVILSDVPLDPEVLQDQFARRKMEKEGKLHAVEATIDSQKQLINVAARHEAFKVPNSAGSTEDVFEAVVFEAGRIEGRIYRKSPGMSFEDIPFTYDVTFKALIIPLAK